MVALAFHGPPSAHEVRALVVEADVHVVLVPLGERIQALSLRCLESQLAMALRNGRREGVHGFHVLRSGQPAAEDGIDHLGFEVGGALSHALFQQGLGLD